jgi:glycosyltransferase involved in cell wall biosynthesis
MMNDATLHSNQDWLYKKTKNGVDLNKVRTATASPKNGVVKSLPEVLMITSYPPRECGIATYSQDLIQALNRKFGESVALKICALETEQEKHQYPDEVNFTLVTTALNNYSQLAGYINHNSRLKVVLLQHEFGFFHHFEAELVTFLEQLNKPVIVVFHTVLPNPEPALKQHIQSIAAQCARVVVMTNNSAHILKETYGLPELLVEVIPHGTHLVKHIDKDVLKKKYNLSDKQVISTFGLLSAGKSIETTLTAMQHILNKHPDVLFLIIGKTHPNVVKEEGEKYRNMLLAKVDELKLQDNVRFVNHYLPLPELLDYLQLTDIYLFTSKDPHQAVSGTFSYAISCGCPIVSTPIPHAREVLGNDSGIIIDFENPQQLSDAVNQLLGDQQLRENISTNGLHKIVSTAWENTAIAHVLLFDKLSGNNIPLRFTPPPVNLDHLKRMTTDFGIIQFAKINREDMASGYTLDDNARAMIALCMHLELYHDEQVINDIAVYLNFIKHCLQPGGHFLNYVDEKKEFTNQNYSTNLADSNGRAIWALGYLIAQPAIPEKLRAEAVSVIAPAIGCIENVHSTRAMAFIIKGLYFYNKRYPSFDNLSTIILFSDRLVQMYRHESTDNWKWFESYLTYANSVLPEALLLASLATRNNTYKQIAIESFSFLLSHTFNEGGIKVVSNKSWMHKGKESAHYGEQPIDVAYTMLALSEFYTVIKDSNYLRKLEVAFNWFLGHNHLNQIIYNPCTGGCYDGLEEYHVNLNQGAESTVSYLLSRLTFEKHKQIPIIAIDYSHIFQLHINSELYEYPRKAEAADSFQEYSMAVFKH